MTRLRFGLVVWVVLFPAVPAALSQTLEERLLKESANNLATDAVTSGDPKQGAILFHQVHIGCIKCHAVDGSRNALGPDLTKPLASVDNLQQHIVTSILKPADSIRKGFETVTVVTQDGRTITGLLVENSDAGVTLRDPARNGDRLRVPADEIDEVVHSRVSVMPAGIVNQMTGRQQFLDLSRYVFELQSGGLDAAKKLQPPPGLVAFKLPEYEARVDHAGLISRLDANAFQRGKEIYDRLCVNCHGTRDRVGSLPTALRFGEGRFKHGGDPYAMYRTLTHGFGLMVPQTWMVPKQKYDVVHYIREDYVRPNNRNQYVPVTKEYLDSLPNGDTFGPEPVEYAPWSDMDYGPTMVNTFEIGSDGSNFAYKGIATRLDPGPGGIARGKQWTVFDHDTLRLAAAWSRPPGSRSSGFINWRGIHFDGRHGTHPRVAGDIQFANPTGPGWAQPGTLSFADEQRVTGRDGRRYGPLPGNWARYRGLYAAGSDSIVAYTVGDMPVLESHRHNNVSVGDRTASVFSRIVNMQSSSEDNLMLIATHEDMGKHVQTIGPSLVVVRPNASQDVSRAFPLNGRFYLQMDDGDRLDMTDSDFSVTARLRVDGDGTIFCKGPAQGPWIPNGKTFFIRDGRLCYDIGWVGVVQSKRRINDGQWHNVALTWNHDSAEATFYIDGQKRGAGSIRPKETTSGLVTRIGHTTDNFPSKSTFQGEIESVCFWDRELTATDIRKKPADLNPVCCWNLKSELKEGLLAGTGTQPINARIVGDGGSGVARALVTGVVGGDSDVQLLALNSRLCLRLPSRQSPRNVVVWTALVDATITKLELRELADQVADRIEVADLQKLADTKATRRWPEEVTTSPIMGPENDAFAVDVLSTPATNPWLARVRLTGHDFFEDGDRAAVCSWDGDVWIVSGLSSLNGDGSPLLKWRRIGSGLFQPLGLKIVAGDIYLTCRDQLVILRDRNEDGETDFYECFNSDHQVTEHFHEFAMGLQRDQVGNFYYAKSARHALKAVVPHHGTLLRIPSDGSRTDILATGFRAANGVCLNPDGSFIVTDQEGHWNPKNRINWVREGGFYGNMFGYHDVTDSSDSAMDQPLCWITNAFDRSPAELLWVDSSSWGPLNGQLLNISYGYGKVYVVPHEEKNGQMQGGMCQLPIPQFPTGTARGRFHKADGGLYLSGMFAWGSSQQAQEGGFYRIRATGKPSWLPVNLEIRSDGIDIVLSDPVDLSAAADPSRYEIKVWALKRTANYGSKHYDERALKVTNASVSDDGRTISLDLPDIAPTWCMEIKCRLPTPNGDVERIIHNTIHAVSSK